MIQNELLKHKRQENQSEKMNQNMIGNQNG
jgi:hypothetical protein